MACNVTLSPGEKIKNKNRQRVTEKTSRSVVRSFVEAIDKGAASVNRLATRPCLNEEGLKMSLSNIFRAVRTIGRSEAPQRTHTEHSRLCFRSKVNPGWVGGWMGGSCAAYRLAAARLFSSLSLLLRLTSTVFSSRGSK